MATTAMFVGSARSSADALSYGKDMCVPTICTLSNGKVLTRTDYINLFVIPNHPDKGGDLATRQFFNACLDDIYDKSKVLACNNLDYSHVRQMAIKEYNQKAVNLQKTLNGEKNTAENKGGFMQTLASAAAAGAAAALVNQGFYMAKVKKAARVQAAREQAAREQRAARDHAVRVHAARDQAVMKQYEEHKRREKAKPGYKISLLEGLHDVVSEKVEEIAREIESSQPAVARRIRKKIPSKVDFVSRGMQDDLEDVERTAQEIRDAIDSGEFKYTMLADN
jgi:hypothetical protein